MRIQDVEFYADSSELEKLTIITDTPQTSSEWLIKSLTERNNADVLQLEPKDLYLQLSSVAGHNPKKCIIIKNAELPILSAANNADEIAAAALKLTESYDHVLVCITLNENLVDPYFETGQQLAKLASVLLYDAQLILQLQPLLTGRARDITGKLVIARGPNSRKSVLEREMFYFVNRTVELRDCF